MKKLVSLFVIVILALAASSPYMISIFLEYNYEKAIAKMDEKAKGFKVKGEFTRGYLHSYAVTTFAGKTAAQTITFNHIIENGPLQIDVKNRSLKSAKLAVIDTKVKTQLLDIFDQQFYSQQGVVVVNTEIGYLGSSKTVISNKPVEINVGKSQIKWGGLNGIIEYNIYTEDLKGSILIPGFKIDETVASDPGKVNSLEFMTMFWEMKQNEILSGEFKGGKNVDINLGIDKIFSKEKGVEVLELTDTLYNIKVKVLKELIDVFYNFQFKTLDFVAENYKVGPAAVNLEVNNIDIKFFEMLDKLSEQYKQSKNITQDQFVKLIEYLQITKPNLQVKATSVQFEQGLAVVEGKINFIDNIESKVKEPNDFAKGIESDFVIKLPKELVQMYLAQEIRALVIAEAKNYTIVHEGKEMPEPKNLTEEQISKEVEKKLAVAMKKLLAGKIFTEESEGQICMYFEYKDGLTRFNQQQRTLVELLQIYASVLNS